MRKAVFVTACVTLGAAVANFVLALLALVRRDK